MDPFWTSVLGVVSVPLTTLFGFLVTFLIQRIKLNSMGIKGANLDSIKLIAAVSVQSAQQKYRAGMVKDKKMSAMETAKKLCAKQGLKISDDLLSELIESGVWDEINSPKATGNPAEVPLTTNLIPVVSNTDTSTQVLG
jgi:hypothetical protein